MKVVMKPGLYKSEHKQYFLSVRGWNVANCIVYERDNVIVHNEKDYRKGYMSFLLSRVLNTYEGKTVRLVVEKDNFAAIALYSNLGFVKVEEQAKFYKMEKSV